MKKILLLIGIFLNGSLAAMTPKIILIGSTAFENAASTSAATSATSVSLETMSQRSVFSTFNQEHLYNPVNQASNVIELYPDDRIYNMYSNLLANGDIAALQQELNELKNYVGKNPLIVHTYEDMQIATLEKMLQQIPSDKKYWYRIINVDNSASTKILVDEKMKEYHAKYLTKNDGNMQRLELERNCLNKELHHHCNFSSLDPQRGVKLRRLSFLNRLLKHYQEQQNNTSNGIQTTLKPGQKPREFGFININNNIDIPVSSPYVLLSENTPIIVNAAQPISNTLSPEQISKTIFPEYDLNHPLHQQFNGLLEMVQLEHPEMFHEYKSALSSIIQEIHQAKIQNGDFKSYREAMAYGLQQYFHHLQPTNPLEHPQEFVINTAKYVGWWVANAACGNVLLPLEKAELAVAQIHELRSLDYSSMTAKEKVDAIAQQAAEITWMVASNKLTQKVLPKKQYGSWFTSAKPIHATKPQVATPEGIIVQVPQEMSETSILQNSAEKLRSTVKDVKTAVAKEKKLIPKSSINTKITAKQAKEIAERLGFKKTNYYSRGQPIFQKGNKFITIDVDSHCGGFWKMANSVENLATKQTRMGTYDQLLNRIGD